MFLWVRSSLRFTNIPLAVALILMMSATAYAGSKYIITSTKQINPKVLSSLKGKAGAAGKPGAQGALGATGPQGAPGATGATGPQGGPGEAGTTGQSVTSKTVAKENANCLEGGSSFTSTSGTTYACNGGKGEPWTPDNVLPKGATETGTWVVQVENEVQFYPISFPIKLSAELAETHVHVIGNKEGEGEAEENEAVKLGECKGTVTTPSAGAGNLCVFLSGDSGLDSGAKSAVAFIASPATLHPGAGSTGALLGIGPVAKPEGQSAFGTWALTG